MALIQSHPTVAQTTPELPPALPRVYAWFSAVNADDMDLLEDLNTHGVPTDVLHPLRHTTALMEATRLGRTATVSWLLARGAAPALLCGLPKGSALHCALRRHHWAVASVLLEHMENASVIDSYGSTLLHALCVEAQHREDLEMALGLAETLLAKGCALDALDHEGITALHHCVVNDAAELAELLMMHGANSNALIPDTWVSPLTIAALEKNSHMANLLMRYNADPYLKTREGSSPASIYPAIVRGTNTH